MDGERRHSKLLRNSNKMMYLDLKDILRERALHFLPAKSLHRFAGVCREWRLMISSPFFAHNQSNAFRKITGLFVQSQNGAPSFMSLDPDSCGVPDPSLSFMPEPVDIKSSSNGLLCCQGHSGDMAYYICNPVTKRWKKLPKPNADHGSDPAIVLIFEPSRLNFVAEYKLVCVFPSADFDSGIEFEIYSSSQGSWRVSGEICYGQRGIIPWSGVHANGVVYWHGHHSKVIAFDLTMERTQLISLIYSSYGSTLGVMDGQLCCASVAGNGVRIYALNNAYSNTMQRCIRVETWKLKNMDCSCPFSTGSYGQTSLPFAGDDMVAVQHQKSLYWCDMKTKEVKSVGTVGSNNTRVFGYVNSLVEL